MTKTARCVRWIQEYFKDNPDGKAIIAISGGKDSTIAAALCVEALGADRVLGVVIPNGEQTDLLDAYDVCRELDIDHIEVNIGVVCDMLASKVKAAVWRDRLPAALDTTTPARLRMTILYMISAMYEGGRVVNTCNRSEDYIGNCTKFGTTAGDFSPLGNLTNKEVIAIGKELGLLDRFINKPSDESALGFSYAELDDYLLNGKNCQTSWDTIKKIEQLHKASRHKYKIMPTFSDVDFVALPEQIILQGE
jgi:NAD+ synthase